MAPRLITTGLAEKERKDTSTLARSLGSLDNYLRDFHAALTLFDFAVASDNTQWCFIACRDGAMTIYHFGRTLQNVRAALGSCPTVNSLIDSKSLRLVAKKFDARFPDFEHLRHAIAHSSELWKNVASFIKNAVTGRHDGPLVVVAKNSRIAMHNNLVNRQFSMSYEGRLVSYEISAETLQRMTTLKDEFYSAFRPAEKELWGLARKASKD